ncbi:hypothetical protein AB0A98_22505 [Streptomyces chrestomyceticus]|uniref:hypothetical protein n=1 Tax=Streptomyces chrestomyceticus TaxID=68185 RepID=UPI0033F646FA
MTTVCEPEGRTRPLGLDDADLRLPLGAGVPVRMPELEDIRGVRPLALRLLAETTGDGGILPGDIGYDEESQTGVYEGLPPGVYMTKNPPKTYGPTAPSGQLDAPDDPGPSDD